MDLNVIFVMRNIMSNIQVWRESAAGEPKFSKDFDVVKKAVLQVTDIKTNRNKYYAIELHASKDKYRVYTHYGRTDDLDSNPEAGVRESRYCSSLGEAESLYKKYLARKLRQRKVIRKSILLLLKLVQRRLLVKAVVLLMIKH